MTPVMRKAAIKFNIMDNPDGRLKRQKEPVPYLGGLSVYLSFLVALCITLEFDRQVLGLLLSATLIVLLGLIDDFGFLSPQIKIMGQILASFVLIKSGIVMELAFSPQWLNIGMSMIWIVAITNSFNIIDIMDGLATGVAFICSIALFFVAVDNGRIMIAVITIALSGSLLAFLRYNFEPARIYLGDTGSLLIGLLLGALAMIGSYTRQNDVAYLSPVVIFGVPIFDTLFVSYIRWRRGMPIFFGSNDHFALRLRKWRLSTKGTVLCSFAVTTILSFLAIIMTKTSNLGASLILIGIIIASLIVATFLKRIDMSM
jgi:UDP-GlcNAc:undecaprenyl-phosphate GlcNAc-1-phosphate transferase